MDGILILSGVLVGLMLLQIPVAFCIGIASTVTLLYLDLPVEMGVNVMFETISSFPLLAVPFFMLLGRLMNDGGITNRLMTLSDSMVGHIRGGLGHVNVSVSMMFASISGSSVADTASVGAVMVPAMVKDGYSARYAAAITAASSTLGNVVPPSILMVIYGSMGDVSIGGMFLGGVIPGIAIASAMMLYNYIFAIRCGIPKRKMASPQKIMQSTYQGLPALSIPVIILGGIIGGVFTATEAAAVAAAVGAMLAFVLYRQVRLRDVPAILVDTVVSFSTPLVAVAFAGMMGWIIAYLGIAEDVADMIMSISSSRFGVSLCIVVFLLFIGTFMSSVTAIIVFLPILQELGYQADIDQVHLGVLTVIMLSLGLVTPPYGVCLLIASQIANVSTLKVAVTILPLVGCILTIVLLSIAFPGMVMYLPNEFLLNK